MRENPIPVAREKSISHSSTSSNEENLLSSGSKSSAAANLVDPYALISKTSASEFRKNNDSISSNTTNEDIDEDEDYNYCDSNEQQVRKTLQIFTEIIQGHLKQYFQMDNLIDRMGFRSHFLHQMVAKSQNI